MLTREEIFVIYEAGPEAVISVIQRLENIIEEEPAIPVLDKNTCDRWLNILIFRNNLISLSTFTEYES